MPARAAEMTARAAVAAAARQIAAAGLVMGAQGNVSVRDGDLVAVSPAGCALGALDAGDVAVVDLAGARVDGPLPASSELALHLAIYAAREERCVVHTHAPAATARAAVHADLVLDETAARQLGGPTVRVAAYAPTGTAQLAHNAVGALEGRYAALLADHGTVAIAGDPEEAISRTLALERACARFSAGTDAPGGGTAR